MSHPNAALTPRHRLIVGRLVADDGWLAPHTACGNQPPVSRLTNVSGQYS